MYLIRLLPSNQSYETRTASWIQFWNSSQCHSQLSVCITIMREFHTKKSHKVAACPSTTLAWMLAIQVLWEGQDLWATPPTLYQPLPLICNLQCTCAEMDDICTVLLQKRLELLNFTAEFIFISAYRFIVICAFGATCQTQTGNNFY